MHREKKADIINELKQEKEKINLNPVYEKLMKCYNSVKEKINFEPKVALVLGSGLGDYASNIKIVETLDYHDIEGFPVSTVPGHKGRFIFGYVGEVAVVCMQGRVHYYEGYEMSDVVLPIRLMKLMGAEILFLTNAAGGIGQGFKAGDLMLIQDHISALVPSPLRGANIDELGVRFPDMSHVYDEDLQLVVKRIAMNMKFPLREGVYMQFTGPQYETPHEVAMARTLGASAAGMSTACEAIAANHMGMKIVGISCMTNLAAGISPNPLTHEEIQQVADKVAPVFSKLVTDSIIAFGNEILS